jgi:glucose/mannose-6-phosphate isomerase
MGGSALAALMLKAWLEAELSVPIEIVRDYTLPAYVDTNTLVIASSYSGNTEETVGCFAQARERSAQVAVVAAGGQLQQLADEYSVAHVVLPSGVQPRMTVMYGLRALTALLAHFGVIGLDKFDEIKQTADWLGKETMAWVPGVRTDKNLAKQLALLAIGKTPVFYAGSLMAPVAYKWKISWNENAKNLAFWNQYPEFNHNEFMGWASHPIEKPFAVFDLKSRMENPQILKRFTVSDRLLSGKRPKAVDIEMQGDSVLAQMLWGSVLADFASIYVAILNGVDPTPVPLIEKLKKEL